jgi:hypothetical protein
MSLNLLHIRVIWQEILETLDAPSETRVEPNHEGAF